MFAGLVRVVCSRWAGMRFWIYRTDVHLCLYRSGLRHFFVSLEAVRTSWLRGFASSNMLRSSAVSCSRALLGYYG